MIRLLLGIGVLATVGVAISSARHPQPTTKNARSNPANVLVAHQSTNLTPAPGHELAAFSGGCFWGAETTYRKMPGVVATAVGYMGGSSENPDYYAAHKFGHAETVLVEFDPAKISYESLLKTFWTRPYPVARKSAERETNPTYRSTIWIFNDNQKAIALDSLAHTQTKAKGKILTRIEPVKPFYLAEAEHQQHDEKAGFETCSVASH